MSAPAHQHLFVPALLALFAACAPAPTDAAAAAAEEEEALVVVTVWSDEHELFYELPAPVVGRPLEIFLHVSRLADGGPRAEGPIRLRWTTPSGEERVEELSAPKSDGLYVHHPAFDEPGVWSLAVEVPGADGLDRVELPSVLVHADAASAAATAIEPPPEGISFLKEQQWWLGLRTELADVRELEQRIVVPGRVEPVSTRHGVVTPPLAGRLEPPPAGALPGLGARVERGELVGYVRPPWSELSLRVQEASAELRAAEVEAARAERAHERVEELQARAARSERELEEARFERDAARARLASARAGVEALTALGASVLEGDELLPRFALLAPVGGVVQEVGAALGEAVEPGRAILHVLDTSYVNLVAHPSPEQLALVDPTIQPRCSRHGSADEREPIPLAQARLVHVAGAITEPGHTVPVVYEIENADGSLLAGELVDVGLATGARREVLAIPLAALVDDAGQPTAYVQLGGETFERRDLELGARGDGYVEVLRGLEAGERVVTRRAFAIRLASASGSVPVHSH